MPALQLAVDERAAAGAALGAAGRRRCTAAAARRTRCGRCRRPAPCSSRTSASTRAPSCASSSSASSPRTRRCWPPRPRSPPRRRWSPSRSSSRGPSSSAARRSGRRSATRSTPPPAAGPSSSLVEGEPGIGKSTLSEAILAHAQGQGWATAVGRCVEPGLAPSLWPCIEIVRTMVDELGTRRRRRTRCASSSNGRPTPASRCRRSRWPASSSHLLDELGDRPRLVAHRRPPLGRPGHARRRAAGAGAPRPPPHPRRRRPSPARAGARVVARRRARRAPPLDGGDDAHPDVAARTRPTSPG